MAIKAYRTLVSSFEKQNKDIDVKTIEASDQNDLLARLSTSFRGRQPPDLFLLNYRFYAQFAAKGVLEPIQSRVNSSRLFRPEGLLQAGAETRSSSTGHSPASRRTCRASSSTTTRSC